MAELYDTTKFEKYLLNKREFINNMLLVVSKDEKTRDYFETESELLEDIIHHFNVFVKGEKSAGISTNEE